jgi:nitroreductase/FMN reductase [NAD(P)H]
MEMPMKSLRDALTHRFGDGVAGERDETVPPEWQVIANRGVCRRFEPRPVPAHIIETLCALALCSPSKSDLQQRDILIVEDARIRGRINALLADQDWIAAAPHFLIFLGNNRRQRQIHAARGHAFVNDHLDAFFNAAVDAGIALSAFVLAAEAAGIGCCPVSVIRNHAEEVSGLLGLPEHVFPVSGLGLGWPARDSFVSLRLPLSATVHRDRFNEDDILGAIAAYDRRRTAVAPYRAQRDPARFGTAAEYGWSEDKARQYATPERADFGAYVRRRGFKLD